MPNTPPQLRAGGNIYPSRFVSLSTSEDQTITQATANAVTIGITQSGTDYPPITGDDHITVTNYAAIDGETVQIFGAGDVCLLTAGAVIAAGALLASDSTGRGTTATANQNVGAIALQAATAANQLILVQVRQQTVAT